jgi:hypothetical protein
LQEKVLELEYVKAVAPKKQEQPLPHDDWVSAVDGSNPRYGCRLRMKWHFVLGFEDVPYL